MWLGNRSFAPEWAKAITSAREVSKLKMNHLPSIHKIRNVQNAQYRSVPLDGVNQIQDVIIKKKNLSPTLTMTIMSTVKPRDQPVSQTKTKQMDIASKDWIAFTDSIRQAEDTILPPAINDSALPDPELKTIMHKGARYNYTAIIKHSTGMHGNERMTKIIQSEEKTNWHVEIEIPWRFTTIFRVKFEAVQYEIETHYKET